MGYMTKLNIQENNFYHDLINDEKNYRDDSILLTLANFGIADSNRVNGLIKDFFGYKYEELFQNSIILFDGERSSAVGKYKEYFWHFNDDKTLSFIDTSIQNIIYFMCKIYSSSICDKDDYEDLEYFLSERDIELEEYISKYKRICENNNYTFDLKWTYDKNKADEFYKTIKLLE